MTEYKNRLRELRHSEILTIDRLAQETGVSEHKICAAEKGETDLRTGDAYILAKFFGCSIEYLCGYTEVADIEAAKYKARMADALDKLDRTINGLYEVKGMIRGEAQQR